MKHRSIDILVTIAVTIVAVTLTFAVTPDSVLGRIWTLPLVLVLPGYALMVAMFPRGSFGLAERLVFSLGLSLTIVILGGFALNWTPFGLRASSWSVLLGSITLGTCVVALVRRRGQSVTSSARRGLRSLVFTVRQGLLLGLAALIVCAAIIVSSVGVAQQPFAGFTQLWILPTGGANPSNVARLGVRNMESKAMQYRLSVNVDGKVVKVWSSIDLKVNEKWEVTLVLPQTHHAAKVEALLYHTNAPTTIYRHVVLWLST
ncbi:MAG: DUF1616 domain-containing protein [Ktedonobacteraceae bacterium]|nr:DUF1616 domain-containing protein [Ktedonobacteraceae bacterium]